MGKVTRFIAQYFFLPSFLPSFLPAEVLMDPNPEETIASGAAVQAALLASSSGGGGDLRDPGCRTKEIRGTGTYVFPEIFLERFPNF